MINSSYDGVVPRSRQLIKLLGIRFLAAGDYARLYFAEPIFKLVSFVDNRPQDIVKVC